MRARESNYSESEGDTHTAMHATNTQSSLRPDRCARAHTTYANTAQWHRHTRTQSHSRTYSAHKTVHPQPTHRQQSSMTAANHAHNRACAQINTPTPPPPPPPHTKTRPLIHVHAYPFSHTTTRAAPPCPSNNSRKQRISTVFYSYQGPYNSLCV